MRIVFTWHCPACQHTNAETADQLYNYLEYGHKLQCSNCKSEYINSWQSDYWEEVTYDKTIDEAAEELKQKKIHKYIYKGGYNASYKNRLPLE